MDRINVCSNLNIRECQTDLSIIAYDFIHIDKFFLKNIAAERDHYKMICI